MTNIKFRNVLQFFILFSVVIVANFPVLAFDTVYFEQPTIYFANQQITSFYDLIAIYLHPKLLHVAIPFFRPSGHFLIYQLITPLIGWHNTKLLLMINLLFLTATGVVIIKLYDILFPNYKLGGYIAFGLYAMHPALHLSRLTIMHFEFAYIFFCFWSLYLFIKYCQSPHKILLFLASMLLFVIAITFKEPALMLGPVLMIYLLANRINFSVKTRREVGLFISIVTITMGVYLTLPWSNASHPLRSIVYANVLAAANQFIKILFALPFTVIPFGELPHAEMTWRSISTPVGVKIILWLGFLFLMLGQMAVFVTGSTLRRSCIFLWLAAGVFLSLPLFWGLGLPWHLSQSLVCISLLIGFSIDFLIGLRLRKVQQTGIILALSLVLLTIFVDTANISLYESLTYDRNQRPISFALSLNKNAVSHPPKLELDGNSILIVEDSLLNDDYMIGNSVYPFYVSMIRPGFKYINELQSAFYAQFHPIYNGNLFKWAYLLPTLREEVYPFTVEAMNDVPDEIIHSWLVNYDSIFCVGYNEHAEWIDKTKQFKENLLIERNRRLLTVNLYSMTPAVTFEGELLDALNLKYPDAQPCQFRCDQNSLCNGFNLVYSQFKNHLIMQCKFYSKITVSSHFCAACMGYLKSTDIG